MQIAQDPRVSVRFHRQGCRGDVKILGLLPESPESRSCSLAQPTIPEAVRTCT